MPIGLPINFGAGSADDPVVEGSIRQRSAGSFELRVFIGTDPDTHRRRYRSMTVRANRAEAERELAAMVAAVRAERAAAREGAISTVAAALCGLRVVLPSAADWQNECAREVSMVYRWLAELVVVVHFLFVAFVAFGAFLALKWPWLVWLHVPVVLWAAAIVSIDFTCPLTPLEKFFRRRAEDGVYEGGFIDHYIRDVVYPGEFSNHARAIVALTIIAGYVLMVSRNRRRRVQPPSVGKRHFEGSGWGVW